MATTKRGLEPSTELESTRKKSKSGNVFSWTDNEIELLLGVEENFESDKQGEGMDWEPSGTTTSSKKFLHHLDVLPGLI